MNTIIEAVPGCGLGPPCIDPAFGLTQGEPGYSFYWSSSAKAGSPNGAWGVRFYDTEVYADFKTNLNYARAVRSDR